jgi:energy-coupling factor transporter transmembrane protein EcfT
VVFLHRLPRWVLLVAVFLLLVVGMAGTGWVAAAGLLVLAVALAWFAYLNWPELDGSGRVLRVVALAILVGFALGRGIGRF